MHDEPVNPFLPNYTIRYQIQPDKLQNVLNTLHTLLSQDQDDKLGLAKGEFSDLSHLVEEAIEDSGFKEAKEVIAHIKGKL